RVLLALRPALLPAVQRLHALLCGWRGPARVVRCETTVVPGRPRGASAEALLRARPVLGLLHACAGLLGEPPTAVWAVAPEGTGFANLTFEFPGGRVAQVSLARGTRPVGRLAVTTRRGGAVAELPRQLRWNDADGGRHSLRL